MSPQTKSKILCRKVGKKLVPKLVKKQGSFYPNIKTRQDRPYDSSSFSFQIFPSHSEESCIESKTAYWFQLVTYTQCK